MSRAGRERTKLYIVIGLSVLFVAVGYFRFFPGKAVSPGGTASEAGAPVRIEVPALALKGLLPAPKAPARVPEPPRTMLRNIFAPGKAPSTGTHLPAAAGKEPSAGTEPPAIPMASAKPLPSLKLTGTITGGKSPLAFINGRSLRLGEKIEGFQVISITRHQVSLEGEGRRMLLNVLEILESGKP
jgi:hypothetical protein